MQKEISIYSFIKTVAEITLSNSASVSENTLKDIMNNKAVDLSQYQKNELLVAEIFISHIPLSLFLKENVSDSQKRSDLLDTYYLNIYTLLGEKYQLFNTDSSDYLLQLFGTLIQSRYMDYYKIVKNSDDYIHPFTNQVQSILLPNNPGPLFLELKILFNIEIKNIDLFIKETSKNFQIVFE